MPRIAPQLALNAVTGNADSGPFGLGTIYSKLTMQTVIGGSPSGGTIDLLGSMDGQTFDATPLCSFTIGTDASGTMKYSIDKPISAYKVTLTGFTGTGSVTVVIGIDSTG